MNYLLDDYQLELDLQTDNNYCSCSEPELVKSHCCVNTKPTEKDVFWYCKKCKKESKK